MHSKTWLEVLKKECDSKHPGLYESITGKEWIEDYYEHDYTVMEAINEAMRPD